MAVNDITGAVMSFFTGNFSAACRSLDLATEVLEGIPRLHERSVTVRAPAVVPVGAPITLSLGWAYEAGKESLKVDAKGKQVELHPGRTATLILDPVYHEVDLAIDVRIGSRGVRVRTDVVRDLEPRLARLEGSPDRWRRDLAAGIREGIQPTAETYFPVNRTLTEAEAERFDSEHVRFARAGKTVLRAQIPKDAKDGATVVVAIHGAGGSENLFFEGYGAGAAPAEAKRRGWVFISPRASTNCIGDSLNWLKETRGISPGKLFVLGHSMGGGIALAGNGPKPNAIAAFAPAARSVSPKLADVPIFLAVGKQEIGMLRQGADTLAKTLPKGSESKVYDPCEHLMIVAEAARDAYRFFDRVP